MNDWIRNPKNNPPPERVIVEVRGCDYMGDFCMTAQRVDYKSGSTKKQLKRKWRWCDATGNVLREQGFDAWREMKTQSVKEEVYE